MSEIVDVNEPVLKISPESIESAFVHDKEVQMELKLTNLTSYPVAYKIKTSAPDRYQVRKTQAIIPPGSTDSCIVMRKAFSTMPNFNNPKEVSHKFLIQSFVLRDDVSERELSDTWKQLEALQASTNKPHYHSLRVPCSITKPGVPADGDAAAKLLQKTEDYNGLMDYSIKQSHQIKKLKTSITELEETVTTTSNDLTKAKKKNEEMERQLQALISEQDDAKDKLTKFNQKQAMAIPVWIAALILVVGLIVGKVIM